MKIDSALYLCLVFLATITFAPLTMGETYVTDCGVHSSSDNEILIVTNDIQATTSPCITVSHANVVVDCEGKTITGPGGGLHFGIRINDAGEGVTIRDCKLTHWWLSILQQSDNGLIFENRMTDCGFGVVLSSANANEVATNVVGRCSWDAIAVLHSNENLIRDNGAFLNPNMRGILLDHSNNNDVVDNRIGRNAGGIYLGESHENNLIDNVSKGNEQIGIRLRDSRDNLIADNNASRNGIGIEEVGDSLNNIYDDNVCRNNTIADSNIEEACN